MSGYHLDSRPRIAFLSLAVFLMLGAGEFVLDAQNLSKSVNADNVTVEQVIGDIQANSDYVFLYSSAVVKGNRRVNITTRSTDVRKVLDELFAGTDVTYSIDGRQIVLKRQEEKPQASVRQTTPSKETHRLSGKVADKNGEPLTGCAVWVKDTEISTITDIDGNYSLTFSGNYGFVKFSTLGFKEVEVRIGQGAETINVVLEDDTFVLEEAVAVGYGHQRKASIVGAITTIDPDQLKVPVSKISNSLAGRLSGVISYQRTGEPGQASTFFIRGVSTFGESANPLVLVDGVERSLDLVDYEDIKEFSVLKDAAATAVYGVRGANGVVLITTRSGEEGRAKINVKVEHGIVAPTRVPKVIDGPTFAKMYNEALGYEYFSPYEIDAIASGTDPDLYPNVDWINEIFKTSTTDTRANINVSGGSSAIKYYVSGGYYNEDGLFKTDPTLAYNTNMFYRKFNFRSNVDVKISTHTSLNINLATTFEQKNKGGTSASTIWAQALYTPSCAFPTVYSTGQYPGPGGGQAGSNPYALVTQTGYKQSFYNNAQSVFNIKHDFSWLTDGLSGNFKVSFDANNQHSQDRTRTPEQWGNAYRDDDGQLILKQIVEGSQTLSFSYPSQGWRAWYLEANLNWARSFGKHNLTALLLYQQSQKNYVGSSAKTSQNALPYRHQGVAGRLTYNYNYRYFIEFNAGYNGSENFSPGHRFGFFPSVAAGWMVSNEKFWKGIKPYITSLKFKGSYGLVGNDNIGGNRRFIYLETIEDGSSYHFGETRTSYSSLRMGEWANKNVGWETARKLDLGFDAKFFDKLELQFDYFYENRSGIFLERKSIPVFAGVINDPWVNIGRMRNSGIDASVNYNHRIGEVTLTGLANFTFARNVILDMDQPDWAELYLNHTGQARWESFGLVADGLFKDEEDIASSPDQSSYYGEVKPGDIKYVDLNGDGYINSFDRKPLGATSVPEIVYGFGLSVAWNGVDVSVFFQGVDNVRFSKYSTLTCGFTSSSITQSNLLADVVDNYWTPERTDASYPRLTNGPNTNNSQLSTFWLVDGRYLRLKNAEIGYSLPKRLVQKAKLQNCRFFITGNNLLLFSPFKLWDPDQNVSGGAAAYPITMTVNAGLNLSF